MNNKGKRMAAVFAALVVLAAGLSACGGAPASTAPGASASTPQTAAAPSSGAAEATTISFGIHVANLQDQEPQTYWVLEEFMAQNPDIHIEVLATASADEQTTQMKLAAESGTLPDVFWNNPGPSEEMYAAGYLMDLGEFLAYDGEADARIGDKLRSMAKDGAVIGLPYQTMVTGFWYNKSLFAQQGVAEPHSGTTFEDMLAFSKTFSDNGITTISNGAKTPYSVWAFMSSWVRYGFVEHYAAIQNGEDSFVNDDFINFFQMIADLRDAGAFPANITTQDYNQGKEAFLSGNAAMLDSGQWDSAEVNEALGEDAGFWWGPTFANGVGNQQVGMQALTNNIRVSAAVGQDAAKQEAVFRFLSFWLSEEADAIRVQYGTTPLATNPTVETDNHAYEALLGAIASEGWTGGVNNPPQMVSEAVRNAMCDAIYGVMSNIYTPAEACQNIQDAQEREMG